MVPSLAQTCAPYFAVGTVLSPGAIATYGDFLPRQFACVTPENHMKWALIEPREGEFDFAAADQIVDFAEKHGLRVIGHNLVWHEQCPDWVFEGPDGGTAPRELVEQRLRRHISAVVGRYRGRIEAWDVVNEGLSDAGEAAADDLRDTKWRQALGDDYIALAFRLAHEADPAARLIYNDFALERPVKRDRMVRLITKLKEAGVPVGAIGMQAHWNFTAPTADQVAHTLEVFEPLGLPVEISELDMSLYNGDDRAHRFEEGAPADLLEMQAKRYAEWFALFRERSAQVRRVSFWGTSDRMTWLKNFPEKGRQDYPLLFDAKEQPKPAFWSVIEAMETK